MADPTAHGPSIPAARDDADVRARAARRSAASGSAARAPSRTGWRRCADLPPSGPCTAEVERRSIRLEREADNWREAARARGADSWAPRSSPLACADRRPRGSSSVGTISPTWSTRCSITAAPRQHAEPCCSAMLVSASGATDAADLRAWAARSRRSTTVDPTGLGGLMQWVALAWQGDFLSSVRGLRRGVRRPAPVAGGARPVRRHRRARPLQPHHRRGGAVGAGRAGPRHRRPHGGRAHEGAVPARARPGRWSPTSRAAPSSSSTRPSTTSPAIPALTRLALPGSAAPAAERARPGGGGQGAAGADGRSAAAGFVRRSRPALLRGGPAGEGRAGRRTWRCSRTSRPSRSSRPSP